MWKIVDWYWDQVTVRPFSSPLSRLRAHILFCVGIGLCFAILLSLVAVIRVLPFAARQDDGVGSGLLEVVGLYLLMGVLGGVLVGILVPLGRWWPGSILVGYLTGTLCFALLDLVLEGSSIRASLNMGLVLGGAFRGPLGFYVWYIAYKEKPGIRS